MLCEAVYPLSPFYPVFLKLWLPCAYPDVIVIQIFPGESYREEKTFLLVIIIYVVENFHLWGWDIHVHTRTQRTTCVLTTETIASSRKFINLNCKLKTGPYLSMRLPIIILLTTTISESLVLHDVKYKARTGNEHLHYKHFPAIQSKSLSMNYMATINTFWPPFIFVFFFRIMICLFSSMI